MKIPPKGVADDKTYKDMYHFNDNFFNKTKKDRPSLNVPDDINATIKENPYKSNVEIEGEEVVLQPDMSALFKAKGKKHSGGGMDVYLKPDSFVFSNDKSLALTPEECEVFEFKKKGGATHTPENYTPAKVLEKNVNVKHYNTMINNIADVKKDDLAKKSSALMLEKYINTLGNIAFLQEKKKSFPQGLPEFSQGTAPVYNPALKNEINEQKQYAKYGGKIGNPYAVGGAVDPECPCGRLPDGHCIPDCPESAYLAILPKARRVDAPPADYNQLYKNPTTALYGKFDVNSYNVPGAIPGGAPNNSWKNAIQGMINKGATLDQLVQQGHGTKEGLQKMFNFSNPTTSTAEDYVYTQTKEGPPNPYTMTGFNDIANIPPDNPSPNNVNGTPQGPKTANWQFTPWQKISQLYNWSQYAGAKRYMPYRSHFNATYAEPSLLNPEQTISDLKGAANQQTRALNTLSPIMRNAQAQSIYGQELDQIPQARNLTDNQNSQVINNFRQYSNQLKNQETQTNLGLDQNYYTQAIEGRKNFDNMKQYLANNAVNNLLGDVQTNQTLAYKLLTENNPAYGYDWKTGNLIRNKKDIRDVNEGAQGDYLESLLKEIDFKSLTADQKINYIRELQRGKALQYLNPSFGQTPPPYKKGGKFNPYK